MKFNLVTDGACKGNPGWGGWAYILQAVRADGSVAKEAVDSGTATDITTNNRMELTAVIAGLEALTKDGVAIELLTDSAYVAGLLNGNKAKKNQDLVNRLRLLTAKHSVEVALVRGHQGHNLNERVDRLAQAAAVAAKAGSHQLCANEACQLPAQENGLCPDCAAMGG